jgi:hypothetical protein
MKQSLSDVLVLIGATLCVLIVIAHMVLTYGHPTTIAYDCRMAEISPDFPPEVRNECRKLRSIK